MAKTVWRTRRDSGIKPRRDTQLWIPEGQRPKWWHIYLIHSGAVVCQNMIIGPITLRTRSPWPAGQLCTRSGLATPERQGGCFIYWLQISLCNSWPFPFLLSSRRLEEQVTTFLILRLSPAEAIKITASSSKPVRSLIIPPRIFPALTGSRVRGSSRLSSWGAGARTGHCEDWVPGFGGWKGTSEWHLCWGSLKAPRGAAARRDCEHTSMELVPGKQMALMRKPVSGGF